MTLTNEELGTAIKELTLRLAEAVHTLTACVKKIDTDLRHHFDVLEVKQSERIDTLDQELRDDMERLEQRARDARNKLAEVLTTRIVDGDLKLSDDMNANRNFLLNRVDDRATAEADARNQLAGVLTTRIVEVDVDLRKVIEALGDRTTAELAALTDELERVVAGS